MSRKANRGAGEPPGRRGPGPDAGQKPKPWAFVVGTVLAISALFVADATLRETFVGCHRDGYVRDELVVENLSTRPASLHGQIASTGERVTVGVDVAGP